MKDFYKINPEFEQDFALFSKGKDLYSQNKTYELSKLCSQFTYYGARCYALLQYKLKQMGNSENVCKNIKEHQIYSIKTKFWYFWFSRSSRNIENQHYDDLELCNSVYHNKGN